MSTLQLEGMRDGLEDLELYRILSAKVDEATARGIDASAEAAALVVAPSLLEGVAPVNDPPARTFSEDPYSLRAQARAHPAPTALSTQDTPSTLAACRVCPQWRSVVAAIKSLDAKLRSK